VDIEGDLLDKKKSGYLDYSGSQALFLRSKLLRSSNLTRNVSLLRKIIRSNKIGMMSNRISKLMEGMMLMIRGCQTQEKVRPRARLTSELDRHL